MDFSYILRSFALSLKNFFPYFLSSGSLSSNSPGFCLPGNLYIMSSLLGDNLKNIYLFLVIWLCQVLVVAFMIFSAVACKLLASSCGLWFLGFFLIFIYLAGPGFSICAARVSTGPGDPHVPLVWCAGPSFLFNIDWFIYAIIWLCGMLVASLQIFHFSAWIQAWAQ